MLLLSNNEYQNNSIYRLCLLSTKLHHFSKPCSRCEDKRINLNICLQISMFNSLNVALITSELNFIKFLTLELKKRCIILNVLYVLFKYTVKEV